MKILLALFAFAALAVLVVSATMGAETLIPGGETKRKPPVGGLAPSGGKARLLPSSSAPQSLKGTGFKPGEIVTVKVVHPPQAIRRAQADGSGSFTVRLPARANRCNGMTVVAVGNKGSRASFQFAQVLCAAPGVKS